MITLNVADIMSLTGATYKTVRSWLSSGRLPGDKYGHEWRVSPDDLNKFLKERKVSK